MVEMFIVFCVISIFGIMYFLIGGADAGKTHKEARNTVVPKEESLADRFNAKLNSSDSRWFLFRGVEFDVRSGGLQSYSFRYRMSLPILSVSGKDHILLCDEVLQHKVFEPYKDKLDWKICFVEDFINEATSHTPYLEQLNNILRWHTHKESWIEIGDGAYYAKSGYSIHKFSDWSVLRGKEAIEAIEGLEIKVCENPKKTHWRHFLELEMKAKKEREVECKEFINSILSKQQEYNDLQYKYEMSPSSPITDFQSFNNFCKIVNEPVEFKEYEITNLLLLKRNEVGL